MEIIVEGNSKEYFIPNEVIITISFISSDKDYEEVMKKGIIKVNEFINDVLLKNSFNNTDLKTQTFIIKESKIYNENTHNYEFDGYIYEQNATLKFDYDNYLLGKIISDISKLENPPIYKINFSIKNVQECHKLLLEKAYNDALEQAKIIASASNNELDKCIKVNYKPFENNYMIEPRFNMETLSLNNIEMIANIFTPEDIEITETLYCVWITK